MKKRHFLLTILISIFILINPVFGKMPELPENEEVYIIENTSQDIVLNQQGEEKIAPKEMNQLMSVLVSLDVIGSKLSDTVVVGEEINNVSEAPELTGFEIGQEVSYQDLLYPILLNSSYDATEILAKNIGSQLMDESKTDGTDTTSSFVKKMNEKAKDLGLKNTNFTNPTGLEEENNYSTIQDLNILTQNAFKNETVKRILGTEEYSIKLSATSVTKKEEVKEDNSESTTEDETGENISNTKKSTEEVETPVIPITNHFLTVFDSSDSGETESSEDLDTKSSEISNDTESDENEEILTENKAEEENKVKESSSTTKKETTQKNDKSSSIVTGAFIANLGGDNSIVAYESKLNEGEVIGCIGGEGAYTIADQVKSLNSELNTNYIFKNLADESGNLGTYKLENTSIFSRKKMDLTANAEIKAFVPKDQQDQIKTNIIWNKEIADKKDDKVTLVQGIEPGTEVAQLKISKGDVKRLVPLYSATKAGVKSWKDTFLIVLFWLFIIAILLLATWRIIYVKNRKKALRRRRALRRKKMARQRKNENVAYSSPIKRMAH